MWLEERKVLSVAIFGNLKEFPLPEVVAMLEGRVGVLKLTDVGSYKQLDLHMQEGQLRGMRVDAQRIKEGFEARSYLLELVGCRQADFVFTRRKPEDLLGDYTLPMRSVVTQGKLDVGEIQQYQKHLPDPATVFTLAQPTNAWLEDNLKTFLDQAQFLLERSSSAKEIAAALRLEVAWVQLALYKLRIEGCVRPVQRMRELQTPPPSQSSVGGSPKPTLISKLLGALGWVRRAS